VNETLPERGPFRIVVLSGIAPRAEVSTRAEPGIHPVPIDRPTFDSVMERLAPVFVVQAADPFDATAEPVRVELRWPNLKALRPGALIEQVPVLRSLVEAHTLVTQARERRLGLEALETQLARVLPRRGWVTAIMGAATASEALAARANVASQPPRTAAPAAAAVQIVPVAASTPSDPMDALFEKVALHPAHAPAPAEAAGGGSVEDEESAPSLDRSGMSAFLAAVAKGARGGRASAARVSAPSPAPSSGAAGAAQRIERALRILLRSVLKDPDVRQVERAWRGLRLLVERADARAGVEVDVIAVSRERVEDALAKLDEQRASGARAAVDLIVVDHEVSRSETDIDQLRAWGRAAEDLNAPLVVNGDASFLEPGKTPIATAGDDALRWVTVAMNGPLVRAAYTAATAGARNVSFSEAAFDEAAHVFGGAGLGIAALAAQSYVETGWGSALTGPRGGVLANLPVREISHGNTEIALPVARLYSEDEVAAAAREGVAIFTSGANQDAAVLSRAPVLGGTSRTRATLGDQLFVGRFAHAVEQLAAALPDDTTEAVAAAAEEVLADLFTPLRAYASVPELAVRVVGGRLEVTVHPRRYAGVTLEELTLSLGGG
jgi:type VI secretion system ImpB/VipA family protein